MKIDPRQPIMFDTDAAPGLGRGYWQLNPPPEFDWSDTPENSSQPNARENRVRRVAQLTFCATVIGIIAFAALDMIIR
ncbi:MAG: hypothetical protein EOO77_37860 [Oxalobacteraceae bacterium]|nr:MAG: hypothetical protein EOO77_37860 [Oxalobacteraceae bacterium]